MEDSDNDGDHDEFAGGRWGKLSILHIVGNVRNRAGDELSLRICLFHFL